MFSESIRLLNTFLEAQLVSGSSLGVSGLGAFAGGEWITLAARFTACLQLLFKYADRRVPIAGENSCTMRFRLTKGEFFIDSNAAVLSVLIVLGPAVSSIISFHCGFGVTRFGYFCPNKLAAVIYGNQDEMSFPFLFTDKQFATLQQKTYSL